MNEVVETERKYVADLEHLVNVGSKQTKHVLCYLPNCLSMYRWKVF